MTELRPYQASANPIRKADPIEAFRVRCEARSMLVDVGMLELHAAVDELQADAERTGLMDELGQDEVQAIMATAFEAVRP
jgi:hypothetical protein